jgi:ABC-type sugar transport system ATPase subunit
MPALTINNVSKSFAGGFALQRITLEIADGEFFVLVGPSGSGKTTLLRIIVGLEDADTGTIHLDGQPIDEVPPHRRGIALVAQRPALYPQLTVAQNLGAGLRFEGGTSPEVIHAKVVEAASWLRLTHLLDRRPHDLSGGEQRRVALGRAVVRGSRVWLLDEPLSQIDPPLRWEFCRELHLLRQRVNTTILYVTHDPIEATALADRIGVLGAGRLLQVGTPEEVKNRPSHRTAALCLGWPPMNVIDGRSEPDEGSGFCFRAGALSIPISWACTLHQPLTLGVRPEDLRLAGVGPPGEGIPLGTWEVVTAAPGNPGWLVTLAGPLTQWVAWSAEKVPAGTNLAVSVGPSRAHWFDGTSGERLV